MAKILRIIPYLRPLNSVSQNGYMKAISFVVGKAGCVLTGQPLWIAPSVRLDLSGYGSITLGHGSVLSENVCLLTHDYSLDRVAPMYENVAVDEELYRTDPVRVEDYAFIGMNAMVLPGVCVGKYSIVGAGSVVTKDVPGGVVVAGNPARELSTVEDYWGTSRDKFMVKKRRS